jgi:N-acetyltransferase
LVQLHFSIDASVLRACPICDLSYTKGAQDDEALHKSHCARVQRGLEWTKAETKGSAKHGVIEIESGIRLKDGSLGRILAVNATVPGKIGSKVLPSHPLSRDKFSVLTYIVSYVKKTQLAALFETISLALSSPPLTPQTLTDSKAYLFLLTPPVSSTAKFASVSSGTKPNVRKHEKIVGCVIAQPIATAMRVIDSVGAPIREAPMVAETGPIRGDVQRNNAPETPGHRPSTSYTPSRDDLITVDASTSLYCSPDPLPTPLGIPRMFVSSSYRRLGIASRLLTAAAENFIHGITLDPAKGEVAFTQPTTSGKALMEKWGKQGARVYRE